MGRLRLPHPGFAACVGKFLQQFLLFGVQLLRYGYSDLYVMIAAAVLRAQDGHALAADAEYRTGLRAGRNFQLDFAIQRVDADRRAQGRLSEGNRFLRQDVISFPRELRVPADEDVYVQIAVAAAAYARFAFAGYAETGSVVDAGRNLDFQFLADLDRAVAVALRALLLDDLARAAAVRAGADVDHLAEGRVLDDALLACAVADGARFYVAARFGAAAIAVVARFILRDLDFHFRAEGGLLKGNIHVETQVCAALRAVCRLAASLAAEE